MVSKWGKAKGIRKQEEGEEGLVRREGREGGEGRGERGEGGESNGWWWQARCVAVALTGSSFGLPRTLPFASNPPF